MATTLTATNEEYIPKKMVDVNCMICNSNNYEFHESLGYQDKFQYVKCKNCGNVYLNPRPEYDDEYLTIAYDQYGMLGENIIKDINKISPHTMEIISRYQLTLKEIESRFGKKGKVLDVGCGTGEFLVAAKLLGWDAYGIDISGPMCRHISENLNIPARAGQFHEMDLSNWGPFDVIFCSHVIEHVPNPNLWMQTYKKYLKKEGILCLNVPNQYAPEKVIQRFLKTIGLRKNKWEKWRTPDHLYEPHLKTIKYLVEKNNFTILDIFTYSSKEAAVESAFYKFFYRILKLGSKIRLFARPNS